MCLSHPTLTENQKNGMKKKNMYLKKIASEMVVNSRNDGSGNNIKVKDVVALVNRNRKNTPMVARKSLPVPYPKENRTNGATKEVINAPKGISLVRPGSEAFYKIFIHSRMCVTCESPKCKKMKKIQAHFMECSRSGQNCPLCKQLIGLLATFVKH